MKINILKTSLALILAFIFLFTSCSANTESEERNYIEGSTEMQLALPVEGETIAVIETDLGSISIRLFANDAPMAVENFIGLANSGYFNGITFHRIVKDFVIQSGDATGTGTGGSTIWNNQAYPLEISDNLHHYTGALGIAHSGSGTDNTSQFYIVQTPSNNISNSQSVSLKDSGMREEVAEIYRQIGGTPHLDNMHTVFAQVFDGMDVVDAIAQVEVDENGQPLEPVKITSVTITTYTAPAEDQSVSESDISSTEVDSTSENNSATNE